MCRNASRRRRSIVYRIFLRFGNLTAQLGVECNRERTETDHGRVRPSPGVVGYRVQGTTIEIPISKTLFHGADRFTWNADAVWWGTGARPGLRRPHRAPVVGGADRDLGATGVR